MNGTLYTPEGEVQCQPPRGVFVFIVLGLILLAIGALLALTSDPARDPYQYEDNLRLWELLLYALGGVFLIWLFAQMGKDHGKEIPSTVLDIKTEEEPPPRQIVPAPKTEPVKVQDSRWTRG